MTTGAKPRSIGLFGNFGSGNLGNEYTLRAMLFNARRHLPDATFNCICTEPAVTSSMYSIPSFPIRHAVVSNPSKRGGRAVRLLRRLAIGIPTEIYRWLAVIRLVMRFDTIIMTGTGMFSDVGITPFGLHYDILRWSIVAKLCRRTLLVVSVGAGPIRRPLSRYFVKAALRLADYRSYRDDFSKQYLESIGFNDKNDAVYPDLAFSLPALTVPLGRDDEGARPVVGLGVMTCCDKRQTPERSEAIYEGYVRTLASFVAWLLQHGYRVRLLIGDVVYDRRVMRDLTRLLRARGIERGAGVIIDEPMSSADDVLSQVAKTDVVVASRFHNLVWALMLNKPAVAISYHRKLDALMASFGLAAFCQDIAYLDLDTLIGQLTAVERDAPTLKPRIQRTTEGSRRALDDQYERLFGTGVSPTTSCAVCQ